MPIKVLLDKQDLSTQHKYKIESENGLIIIFPCDKNKIILEKSIELSVKQKKFLINGKEDLEKLALE